MSGIRNIRGRALGLKGAAILQFISKYSNVAIQLLVTAILARLVSPEDFGLLALVSVFTSFFQIFADIGISSAIIQYDDLTEHDYGALFFFTCLFALVVSCVFSLCSFPISLVYGDKRLFPLCLSLTPSILFSIANMVPNGLMLRDKRFAKIALRLIVVSIVSGSIAIVFAIMGAGCYALVAQTVISTALVLFWNLLSCPIKKINIHFVKPLNRVFSYSAFQFGFSLVNYFSRNLDNMLVGGTLGPSMLGYYDKAYKLTTYPMNNISAVISSVVQPYMAKNQDEKSEMFRCWKKIVKPLSLVGGYITSIFIVAPYEVVVLFYGPGWDQAVVPFQLLGISVAFQMIGNPSGAFFQSLGRTDLMFRCGLINSFLSVSGALIGAMLGGINAIAACVSIAYCFQVIPLGFYLLKTGMSASFNELKVFVPGLLLTIAAVFFNILFAEMLPMNIILRLLLKMCITFAIFFVGYFALSKLAKHFTIFRKLM